jgi:hypothetical protein
MDRIKILAMVGDSTTRIELSAQDLTSVQMWDGGMLMVKMRGCTYEGQPVNCVQARRADLVFVYMERKENSG